MIILGIDPGSRHTGYGVIESAQGKDKIIEYGVLNLEHQSSHPLRLKRIYDRILAVLDRTLPDECAIEMPVYGRNPQSMLKLGRAQAAVMLAAMNREIPVTEYTPKEVKKSVTGNGNASKEQVWFMVKTLLELSEDKGNDASDALAVSLCHAHRFTGKAGQRQHKNWKSFIEANADRIIGE
jgi:crossover junction endodeoxyribonuclease RuvC